jgi:hypothetical protein
MKTGVFHSCFLFGRSQIWLSVLKSVKLQNFIAYINPCENISSYYSDTCHGLTFPHRLQFTILNQHLITQYPTYPDETRYLNKEKQWENGKKLKGTASSSNQRCKGYITFNVIIVVLRHEPNFFPVSAIRCYSCFGNNCKDPYEGSKAHERDCELSYCWKASIQKGKWLHNPTSIFI